ncbi:MAG: hypothetical protein ABIQ57_14585 [Candidatus Kapaibacterium sp.]
MRTCLTWSWSLFLPTRSTMTCLCNARCAALEELTLKRPNAMIPEVIYQSAIDASIVSHQCKSVVMNEIVDNLVFAGIVIMIILLFLFTTDDPTKQEKIDENSTDSEPIQMWDDRDD